MRHPSARDDGGRHLSVSGEPARWLLVGNSRWHLAERHGEQVRCRHGLAGSFPLRTPPLAWAAVGTVPPECSLPPDRRLRLEQVPLRDAPPWLGIDRALVGWEAWRQARRPVLVADAGTVLSLTLVDGEGRFRGGRLLPGLALQLRSMAQASQDLPLLEPPWSEQGLLAAEPAADSAWPRPTAAAMLSGVGAGLAAAIEDGLTAVEATLPSVRLVLTGGDAELMQRILAGNPRMGRRRWRLRPWLCLESLMRLRPSAEGA